MKKPRKTSNDSSANDENIEKPKKKKSRISTDDLVTPKVPVVPTAKIPKKKPIVVSPQKDSKKPYVQPLEQGMEFILTNFDYYDVINYL